MLENYLLEFFRVVDMLLAFDMKSVSPCVYILKAIVGLIWMGRGGRWHGCSLNYQFEILFSFLKNSLYLQQIGKKCLGYK